jgi:hypothetical protein
MVPEIGLAGDSVDLRTAEQLNGKFWQRAKVGALLCFLVASLLLLASLLSPRADPTGSAAAMTSSMR